MSELAQIEADIERLRQIDKLAALLHEYPMPRAARIKIATTMFDGGARMEPVAKKPAKAVKKKAPAKKKTTPEPDSPLRAKLRAENPEMVAMIDAALAAKDAGDESEWLRLHSEIRPRALAELQKLKEQAAKIGDAGK